MSGSLNNLPPPQVQFLDGNGRPLAGGMVFTYVPNTQNFKQTWRDPGQAASNQNPVVLDANGEAPIFGTGTYYVVVQDQYGNQITTGLCVCGVGANANAINWTGPFSTNVTMLVGTKLDQKLSVLDFGATSGQGATDCGAAVQASLDAVGYAYFPDGDYVINTPIYPPPGCAIFGDSDRATIATALTVGAAFVFGNSHDVSFRFLTFVGTAATANAIFAQTTSLLIDDCVFYGCNLVLDQCYAFLLTNLRFAPSPTQPAGQLDIYDQTLNEAASKDGVLANITYEGSNGGSQGVPSTYCVRFLGCTRINVVNLVVNIYNVSDTPDLVQVLGTSLDLNFSNLQLTGGANGINIQGGNGAPAAVGGSPSQINISNSMFVGQVYAGVLLQGYSNGSGGLNSPSGVNIVGCSFGVGGAPQGGQAAAGVYMSMTTTHSVRACLFYVGPQYNSPSAPPNGVVMAAAPQNCAVEDNSFVSMNYGFEGSFGIGTCTISNNRFWFCTTAIYGVPGAVRLAADPLYTTPLLNVVRDNKLGNPPESYTSPALTAGGTALNDSGFDQQVLLKNLASSAVTLTSGGTSFSWTGTDGIFPVNIGDYLTIGTVGGSTTWTWIPK